jgi:hypothetical protein
MGEAMSFYERYLSLLSTRYPKTSAALDPRERLSQLLICPTALQLPYDIAKQAEEIVRAFYRLRNSPDWKIPLETLPPPFQDPGNSSILMSYDFHIDTEGRLRLIEINTNASMSLLADLSYELQELKNPFSRGFREEIIESFAEEARLALVDVKTVAIIDENPTEQRLYFEFELYRELFEKRGWNVLIADPSALHFENGKLLHGNSKIDLIYNRHTDFYLESNAMSGVRAAAEARAVCLTPHPHEYRLLADKARLRDLSMSNSLDPVIAATLIKTIPAKSFESMDALWAERKKWFFKPSQSFGGKAVYRGTSLSRSTFNKQVVPGDYLVQEYIPAPEITIEAGEFKYDLRFFAYRDKIQLACARLYQGQMTNSKTLGGGIAAIDWR